tara:strand:- start:2907 stop:3659 length:753 start_codon:yes stop_codon:yes gene_type:complete
MKKKKILLAIGGHDPTSGAGISADIETSAYFNFHTLSILTCITVQNTNRVQKIYKIPKNYIIESFKEIIKEFKIDVIKIGLLPNIQCSKEVFKILNNKKVRSIPVIIDPIINSGSGEKLITDNNLKFLIKKVYPFGKLLTPNIDEYNKIKKLLEKDSANNILITNFKNTKNSITLKLKKNDSLTERDFVVKKFNKIYHGTGCTLSTAIACNIDPKKDIDKSIQTALKYMKKVITASTINGKKQSFLNRNF